MIFTVELTRLGKLERELWRFDARPSDPMAGKLVMIRLQSFELQRREFTNEAWTIEKWWAQSHKITTRLKRVARPKITPVVKAMAFRMLEREVTWR